MIRVLQVVQKPGDYQTRTAIAQLSGAGPQVQSTAWNTDSELPLAIRAAANLRRRSPEVDLIHAWGDAALKIAAFSSRLPIIFSPTRSPDRSMIRWLGAIQQYRTIHVIAPTETARRTFVERGIAMERCHFIPPGVDFGRVDKSRRVALRATLGFKPEHRVILAVGESTRATDHALAAWTGVIMHVLDRNNRLLLWGRGPMAESTRRFAHKLGQPEMLSVATDHLGAQVEFEELLAAADFALITHRSPAPTLPIAMCMAAGIPIVSVVDSTICELLEDRHNSLLCTARAARPIARRLLDLQEDSAGQWARLDQARAEAFEKYSRVRFVNAMTSLYQTVLDERS